VQAGPPPVVAVGILYHFPGAVLGAMITMLIAGSSSSDGEMSCCFGPARGWGRTGEEQPAAITIPLNPPLALIRTLSPAYEAYA
jgi:hypothetical protein